MALNTFKCNHLTQLHFKGLIMLLIMRNGGFREFRGEVRNPYDVYSVDPAACVCSATFSASSIRANS